MRTREAQYTSLCSNGMHDWAMKVKRLSRSQAVELYNLMIEQGDHSSDALRVAKARADGKTIMSYMYHHPMYW